MKVVGAAAGAAVPKPSNPLLPPNVLSIAEVVVPPSGFACVVAGVEAPNIDVVALVPVVAALFGVLVKLILGCTRRLNSVDTDWLKLKPTGCLCGCSCSRGRFCELSLEVEVVENELVVELAQVPNGLLLVVVKVFLPNIFDVVLVVGAASCDLFPKILSPGADDPPSSKWLNNSQLVVVTVGDWLLGPKILKNDASNGVEPKPECFACGIACGFGVPPKLNELAGVVVAVVPNPPKPVTLACCCWPNRPVPVMLVVPAAPPKVVVEPNSPPVVVVAAGCAPNKLVVCCDGVPKVVV